jgi:hypothetical protein
MTSSNRVLARLHARGISPALAHHQILADAAGFVAGVNAA